MSSTLRSTQIEVTKMENVFHNTMSCDAKDCDSVIEWNTPPYGDTPDKQWYRLYGPVAIGKHACSLPCLNAIVEKLG